MNFGRLPDTDLMKAEYLLAPDPLFNKNILKGTAAAAPKIYIGCAKWGRKDWIGKIYPLQTKEKDFLDNYIQHYNSIELNATHYKMYDSSTIQKWADKTASKDFKFCPKMYKGITHFGNLESKQQMTADFVKNMLAFKKQLGPILIQMPEKFSIKRKDELFSYLEALPKDVTFFVEMRHEDWFSTEEIRLALFAKLKQLKIGAVITDTLGRRDCVHMYCTVPKAFIRFVGNNLHETDYIRIDAWVKRIKQWLANGLKELYFFMHMHDEGLSPELTVYLVDKLNKTCGLKLQRPVFIDAVNKRITKKINR